MHGMMPASSLTAYGTTNGKKFLSRVIHYYIIKGSAINHDDGAFVVCSGYFVL